MRHEKIRKISKAILERQNGGWGFFSLDQVVKRTGLNRCEVCHQLEKFCLEKILRKISARMRNEDQGRRGRPYFNIIYRLIGQEALQKKINPKLKDETAQDRMWKVIRYLRDFTVRDLIRLAEAKREHARWFVKMLRRGGFVKPSKPGGPGVTWTLIKDPGPRRPYVGGKEEGIKDAKNRKDQAAED